MISILKFWIWMLGLLAFSVFGLSFSSLSSQSNPPSGEQIFQWGLEDKDVLELNEYHKVQFRSYGSMIYREDKNRITLKASQCDSNSCQLEGVFDTYVRFGNKQGPFQKDKTFESKFVIMRDGMYEVPDEYIMPNLRSLPAFPRKPIRAGDSWKKKAEESFDLPAGRIRIPVNADYVYEGKSPWKFEDKSGEAEKIVFSYNLFYEDSKRVTNLPNKVYGFARGMIWFDPVKGVPEYKEVKLSYTFVFPNGSIQEANFSIAGIYQVQKSLDNSEKDKLQKEISDSLMPQEEDEEGGIYILNPIEAEKGIVPYGTHPAKKKKTELPVQVRRTNDGITISLNSVLFDHDRSDLKPEALETLEKISEVLKKHSTREVRIGGHTDNSGTMDYNQKLSEERAKNVLGVLSGKYGIPSGRLSYKGYGDRQPVESNATEEGRKRNRRVDITLMVE